MNYDYQIPLIEQTFQNILTHKIALLAACPGAGKTNMAIRIIEEFKKKFPKSKIIVLTHGQNILKTQFSERMEQVSKLPFKQIKPKSLLKTKLPKSDILIGLPQTLFCRLHEGIECDLLIVDEAHQFYTAQFVQAIIEAINPKFQLLLTGTPSKFVGKMSTTSICVETLMDKGILTDPFIRLESAYIGEIELADYDKRRNLNASKIVSGSSKSCLKNLLLKMPDLKSKRTMVICNGQTQAKELYSYLKNQGIKSHLSISDVCKNSSKTFENFKKEGQFLIVANRGILGFDYPALECLIDFSMTMNINRLFQQICRVVRKDGNKEKFYIKVFSDKLTDETQAAVLGAMSMVSEDGYLRPSSVIKPVYLPEERSSAFFTKETVRFSDLKAILTTEDVFKFRTKKGNLEKSIEEMRKYKNFSLFRAERKTNYNTIRHHDPNILRNYFKDAPKERNHKRSIEDCIKEMNKYKDRTDFKTKSPTAYKMLIEQDRDAIDKKFPNKMKNPYASLGEKDLTKAVLKYSGRKELNRKNLKLYNFMKGHHLDLLDKVLPSQNPYVKYTDEQLTKECSMFKTRNDLKERNSKLYYIMTYKKMDLLDKVIPVMNSHFSIRLRKQE